MDRTIEWRHVAGDAAGAMSRTQIQELNSRIEREGLFLRDLMAEVGKQVVGQTEMVERVLVALLTGGHILLEGVPGLAKTLMVSALAGAISARFSRIQFTPDLLPADLLGTQIYSPKTGEFSVHRGPIFANIVLADEVNRAPAKVQSALLEAMQERQVTIAGGTFPLGDPFIVLATQNPIEHEGTYPLPEAQVDRFMLKVIVDYPSRDEERRIVDLMAVGEPEQVRPVVGADDVSAARAAVRAIYVDARITEYVLDLVLATRDPAGAGMDDLSGLIAYGASPRASIHLVTAARAHAFLRGRGYVVPEDVKQMAPDVLRHRVITTYEAEAAGVDGSEIVARVLDAVEVP